MAAAIHDDPSLTCHSSAECRSQALCAAIVADPPLALLLCEHELVATVMLVHGLVVEEAVPCDVMRERSFRRVCAILQQQPAPGWVSSSSEWTAWVHLR